MTAIPLSHPPVDDARRAELAECPRPRGIQTGHTEAEIDHVAAAAPVFFGR